MKKLLMTFLAAAAAGCSASAPTPVANSNVEVSNRERLESSIQHSTENGTPPPAATNNSTANGKWSQSGNPIDTAKFDGVINEAEKAVKSKPNDDAAKKVLSEAYYDRGFALTEAKQYASALGDYRKALKYDPTNEDAKNWIDQIISIYGMLKKEYPKEGEEPPPLPFKKDEAAPNNAKTELKKG